MGGRADAKTWPSHWVVYLYVSNPNGSHNYISGIKIGGRVYIYENRQQSLEVKEIIKKSSNNKGG